MDSFPDTPPLDTLSNDLAVRRVAEWSHRNHLYFEIFEGVGRPRSFLLGRVIYASVLKTIWALLMYTIKDLLVNLRFCAVGRKIKKFGGP